MQRGAGEALFSTDHQSVHSAKKKRRPFSLIMVDQGKKTAKEGTYIPLTSINVHLVGSERNKMAISSFLVDQMIMKKNLNRFPGF